MHDNPSSLVTYDPAALGLNIFQKQRKQWLQTGAIERKQMIVNYLDKQSSSGMIGKLIYCKHGVFLNAKITET